MPEIPAGCARPIGAVVGAKPSEPQTVEPAAEKEETTIFQSAEFAGIW